MKRKLAPPLEGVVYGEISAWITILGMAVASVGFGASLFFSGGVMDTRQCLRDLLAGASEQQIWRRDSTYRAEPPEYWFFQGRECGDKITMIGVTVAACGSIVGLAAAFFSMFRSRRILLYKGGLFAVLLLAILAVMLAAALGLVAPAP